MFFWHMIIFHFHQIKSIDFYLEIPYRYKTLVFAYLTYFKLLNLFNTSGIYFSERF